ncbi:MULTISPECIES: DUF2493 domain-containing protein [unclassified Aurantimonas]|uniref:DUF2493 domain-containing protein n=1 Tax=unclassified Aurantimonas TaxID=2638230 RepID=UPI002E18EC68|nr:MULTISPECIES: DUF2493 domain-containing protein [unclassified Aurantimonas]MEC5291909.1 DUF2493 domain-containing protein [Aurantimonas sp. C2-3-R2]MEC5412995.1 DUF2493 domain-containing protein [Aurantimonas sp. C2-4-R8]
MTHFQSSSQTERLFDDIALYGVTPGSDERDTRELPDAGEVEMKIGWLMSTMGDIFAGSRLEAEADEMLWSIVNAFHRRIAHAQKRLDDNEGKYPDMVLMHGGSTKGAELIAARWAANRGVTAIAFKPDFVTHQRAAPFKRNDQMLELMPQGVIAAPGAGISENLVDKAKKLGIKVMRVGA